MSCPYALMNHKIENHSKKHAWFPILEIYDVGEGGGSGDQRLDFFLGVMFNWQAMEKSPGGGLNILPVLYSDENSLIIQR